MSAAGLGMSIASEGLDGLAYFAGGILGGMAGSAFVNNMKARMAAMKEGQPAAKSTSGAKTSRSRPSIKKKLVIDHTEDALQHYLHGNGETVELGLNTKVAIISSEEQTYRLGRITSGQTSSLKGDYGVNLEFDGWDVYHVGNTNVYYDTACGNSTCTTTFTNANDGFWDPVIDIDGIGPYGEFGTPFRYEPFSWKVTFPKP